MSLQEQFARAFLSVRSTFGGGAALHFWERVARPVLDKNAKATPQSLQAAFVAAWADAATAADTKKGKVRRACVLRRSLQHSCP
jgi:hypothetical protein